jgi:hypothetical protein
VLLDRPLPRCPFRRVAFDVGIPEPLRDLSRNDKIAQLSSEPIDQPVLPNALLGTLVCRGMTAIVDVRLLLFGDQHAVTVGAPNHSTKRVIVFDPVSTALAVIVEACLDLFPHFPGDHAFIFARIEDALPHKVSRVNLITKNLPEGGLLNPLALESETFAACPGYDFLQRDVAGGVHLKDTRDSRGHWLGPGR